MRESFKDFYTSEKGQWIEDYEKSHANRFDFLISDLKLNEIKNSKILDVGCGYGPIFNRLNKENNNEYIGIDGADIKNNFQYYINDLSYDFFSKNFENAYFDYIFCFETLEHLTNPYHCLIEIKNLLKEDSILYLSIPNIKTEHNTIYPSLLYPIQNFVQFLGQMAFEIQDYKVHDKSFYQEVFVLKNKNWNFSKMLWPQREEKFKNIPPHIFCNL